MPANDATPRIWYSVVTASGGTISIEHRALTGDHATAAAKCAVRPTKSMPARRDCLWPNCDVLPKKEVRERGIRLKKAKFSGAGRWIARGPRSGDHPQQLCRRASVIPP
jgi:hypothetical protein